MNKHQKILFISLLIVLGICRHSNTGIFAESLDTSFQKEIARYGDEPFSWVVVINYMDVSNPMCQIKGVATGQLQDALILANITIWKQKSKDGTNKVCEVGNIQEFGKLTQPMILKEGKSHNLMIETGSVTGIRRHSNPDMALFNVGHGMLEQMCNKEKAIAVLTDINGNNIDLIIDLKGLKEAWSHCEPK